MTSPTVNRRRPISTLVGADDGRDAPARATTAAWLDEPAPAGEHALGGLHAVDVLGRRLPAHEDHRARPVRGVDARRRR